MTESNRKPLYPTTAPRMHASLTPERIADAIRRHTTTLDNPGFCIECGHEQGGVEPDAEKYECESCGEMYVYGAEQLLMLAQLPSDEPWEPPQPDHIRFAPKG